MQNAHSVLSETPTLQWDMTVIFPSLESPEFVTEFEVVLSDVSHLAQRFEAANVRRRSDAAVDAEWVTQWESILTGTNALIRRLSLLHTYIRCFVTTDARNDLAKSRQSQLEAPGVTMSKLDTRLTAWTGSSDIERLLELSPLAREHEFYVRRAQTLAQHQMSETEENLTAELSPMNSGAWVKLQTPLSRSVFLTDGCFEKAAP